MGESKRPGRILFLDIDGVLNTTGDGHGQPSFHPDKVARLNTILGATGAQIVMSSAWRYLVHRGEMNLRGLSWLLKSHGVLDRLVGVTDPDSFVDGHLVHDERGDQISRWLASATVSQYVVIDDQDLGIHAAGHPFVKTNGKYGLTDRDVAKAIRLFERTAREVTNEPNRT